MLCFIFVYKLYHLINYLFCHLFEARIDINVTDMVLHLLSRALNKGYNCILQRGFKDFCKFCKNFIFIFKRQGLNN